MTEKEEEDWFKFYHGDKIRKKVFEQITHWREYGRKWSGTFFTSGLMRDIANYCEEEIDNAKLKLKEEIKEWIETQRKTNDMWRLEGEELFYRLEKDLLGGKEGLL